MDEVIEMVKGLGAIGLIIFVALVFITVSVCYIACDVEKIRKHILNERNWYDK